MHYKQEILWNGTSELTINPHFLRCPSRPCEYPIASHSQPQSTKDGCHRSMTTSSPSHQVQNPRALPTAHVDSASGPVDHAFAIEWSQYHRWRPVTMSNCEYLPVEELKLENSRLDGFCTMRRYCPWYQVQLWHRRGTLIQYWLYRPTRWMSGY